MALFQIPFLNLGSSYIPAIVESECQQPAAGIQTLTKTGNELAGNDG